MQSITKWLLVLILQAWITAAQTASATAAASSASATDSADDGGDDENPMTPMIVAAHASVMSLAFLFFYPTGALIMRLGRGRKTVWIHAGFQFFAYMLAIAGLGLGLWLALQEDYLNSQTYHVVIGITVVCALVLQPILGSLHHLAFKSTGSRTLVSYVHIWWGRALMTLGAINGGFGVQLSADSMPGTIAYGVFAGIIYVGYFAVVAATSGRKKKRSKELAAVKAETATMES